MLQSNESILVFDLETTGPDPQRDEIVQFGYCIIESGQVSPGVDIMIKPEKSISDGASRVHGITYEDVKDCQTFKEVSSEIQAVVGACDGLCGFNSLCFDWPILKRQLKSMSGDSVVNLTPELPVIDVMKLYHKRAGGGDLQSALRVYCNRDLPDAHKASIDSFATAEIFNKMVHLYNFKSIDEIIKDQMERPSDWIDDDGKIVWRDGEAVIPFGKHSGKSLKTLCRHDRGYLNWMLSGSFPQKTKEIIHLALKGHFPNQGVSHA